MRATLLWGCQSARRVLPRGCDRHRNRRDELSRLEEAVEVAQREASIAARVSTVPLRDVGQQHDVVHRQQRLGHVRLVGEDVQARAGQPAVDQRLDQRVLVDDAAARDVDQVAVGAERVENLGVDQLLGAAAARGRDDQHVDPGAPVRPASPTYVYGEPGTSCRLW